MEDSVTIRTKFQQYEKGGRFNDDFIGRANQKYSKIVVSREDLGRVLMSDGSAYGGHRDRLVSGTPSYELALKYFEVFKSKPKVIDIEDSPGFFMLFLRNLNEYEILISLQALARVGADEREGECNVTFLDLVNFAESISPTGTNMTEAMQEKHRVYLEETAQEFASNYSEFRRKYYDQARPEEVTFQLWINAYMDYANYDHVVTLRRMISLRERNRDDLIENGLRFKDYFTKLVPVPNDPKHSFLHRMLSEGVLDPLTVTAKTPGVVFKKSKGRPNEHQNSLADVDSFMKHLEKLSAFGFPSRPVAPFPDDEEIPSCFPPLVEYRERASKINWVGPDLFSGLKRASHFFKKSHVVYVSGSLYGTKGYTAKFGDREVKVFREGGEGLVCQEHKLTGSDIRKGLARKRLDHPNAMEDVVEQNNTDASYVKENSEPDYVRDGESDLSLREITEALPEREITKELSEDLSEREVTEDKKMDGWIKDFVSIEECELPESDLLPRFSDPIEQVKTLFIGTEFQKLVQFPPPIGETSVESRSVGLTEKEEEEADDLWEKAVARIAFNLSNELAMEQNTILVVVTPRVENRGPFPKFMNHIRGARFPMNGTTWIIEPVFPVIEILEHENKKLEYGDLRIIVEFGKAGSNGFSTQGQKGERYTWKVTLNDSDRPEAVETWTKNLRDALIDIIAQL